jgi:hypothetical protein
LYNNPDLGWALSDIVAAAVKNSSEVKCMQPLVQMLKNKSVADHKDKLKGILIDWMAGYKAAITKKDKKPSRAEFADMNKCTASLLRAFVANFDVKTVRIIFYPGSVLSFVNHILCVVAQDPRKLAGISCCYRRCANEP